MLSTFVKSKIASANATPEPATYLYNAVGKVSVIFMSYVVGCPIPINI